MSVDDTPRVEADHFSNPDLPKCEGYYGAAAQLMAADRRARQRKLIKLDALCKRVVEWQKNGWTPEQIGNRIAHQRARPRVCQETIYRYNYSKEGMADDPWWYLPNHRKYRKPRRARKRQAPEFDRDVSILFRPDDVAHRCQFGHWEANFIVLKHNLGQISVTSLVDRVSRFTVLLKNPNKKT